MVVGILSDMDALAAATAVHAADAESVHVEALALVAATTATLQSLSESLGAAIAAGDTEATAALAAQLATAVADNP